MTRQTQMEGRAGLGAQVGSSGGEGRQALRVEIVSLGREVQNNLRALTGTKATQMTWCSQTLSRKVPALHSASVSQSVP